jgi:hypothetical protein
MTQPPKQCRAGHPCEPQTLREACDCLAHHSSYSLPQMCERSGLDYNRIAKSTSLHNTKHRPSLDDILVLTLASADEPSQRNYVVVRYLLRQLGGAFVLLPAARPETDAFLGVLIEATERLSAMGREIHESLRDDGEFDADEHARTHARVARMHEQISVVGAMVDERFQAGPFAPAPTAPTERAVRRRIQR